MLFLACLLAASASAARFAQSPAQMTASVREYFASPAAEPAGLSAALSSLEGVDVDDPASALALENLSDDTRKAADDLLERSEKLLAARNPPPDEDQLARSLELFHVLQRTPLSRFLSERQRVELFRYEHEVVTMTEKETAERVEKRLAALSEGLEKLSRPAPAAPAAQAGRPGPVEAAKASSPGEKRVARRAAAELRGYRRRTRRAASAPAVDKPVRVPDWLRGPAPLSAPMQRAHGLAAASDFQGLLDFALSQTGDEETQRFAARELAGRLERGDEAAAGRLAVLGAASRFGRVQEIALSALAERGRLDEVAAVGEKATLPHIRAWARRLAGERAPNP